jgi:hypothetical protein
VKRLLMGAGALVMAGGLFGAPSVLAAEVRQDTPVGTVHGYGDPATQSGGVYADGNGGPTGNGPQGYIGVNSSEGVVGCWTGNYSTGGGNNVITAIPPSGAPAQPNPASPCSPKP